MPNKVAGKEVQFNPNAERERLTKQAMRRPARKTVIAPGDELFFGMQEANQAYSVAFDKQERRDQWLSSRLCGLFIYDDVWGDAHTLFCVYRHDPASEGLSNEYEDGYSD